MSDCVRKIDFLNLPITNNHINWGKSLHCIVDFHYDDIYGSFEILTYNTKTRIFTIKYLNNVYSISYSNFINCHLGSILNYFSKEYRYNIGDIVSTNTGEIKIIDKYKMKKGTKYVKGYKYKCLKDGYIDDIYEYRLNKGSGCPVCCNQKIIVGYNDMWTTIPIVAKLLANPKDGYKHTYGSISFVDWKCPECGHIIKHKMISQILRIGLSCPYCSDKISYPEKIMYNLLKQINIKFTYQLTKSIFKWCDRYRYDFYIPSLNCIIETHGIQHYEESPFTRTLKEEQENDKLKENLAKQNNIEKYIVIDCRYSELEYIKNNILQSELSKLFDLSQINWIEIALQSQKSLVKKACELWNNGIYNIDDISNKLSLSISTIKKYLKIGNKLCWCNFLSTPNNNRKNAKKVICLTTNEVFGSMYKAELKYKAKNIYKSCDNKNRSAGKLPDGTKLRWMYYDEYIKMKEDGSDFFDGIRSSDKKIRDCNNQ